MTADIHPCAQGWALPTPNRPSELGQGILRISLRMLCAREGRIEHHLMVVARIGVAQLEVPTASEPLAFAHVNLSDEYVVVLPTGHAMLDGFPFRVFVTDPESNLDVMRIQHRVLELVLHPYGFSHWPGRLRAPYTPMAFPEGARRAGLTLVFCAGQISAPPDNRPLWMTPGLEASAKVYVDHAVPVLLADLKREQARVVGQIADVHWELLVDPLEVAPSRGGYLVVLDAAEGSGFATTDLVYIPAGARLSAQGINRALLMSSERTVADPPPDTWHSVPTLPFTPFERATAGALPLSSGALSFEAQDDATVRISLHGETRHVPRYWLARMLFRVALHDYRLGYVETYEGFFYDDTHGKYLLGLRGVGHIELQKDALSTLVKQLYYAVAPAGYVEDLR